jgi:hypothetical protein
VLSDRTHPDNYFTKAFEGKFACNPTGTRMSFGPLEKALQGLDGDAWKNLAEKARPWTTKKEPLRQWSQLFNHLYEAFGYEWLAKNGYTSIRFIDRRVKEAKQTPELLGKSATSTALLEVKTINNSDEDIASRARRPPPVFNLAAPLPEGLKRKLADDVEKARQQLMTFEEPVDRRIVLVVINPDCAFWLNAAVYQEINELAAKLSTGGLEVVMRNLVT